MKRMNYRIVDFNINHFDEWKRFSYYMNELYVGEPWFFGYKCPDCDENNFDINDNSLNPIDRCEQCNSELIPFFAPSRAKKYFSRRGFIGKLLLRNDDPVAWILGFEENLQDHNDKFPSEVVLNISYLCKLDGFRTKNTGPIEKFKRAIFLRVMNARSSRLILEVLFSALGKPALYALFEDFEKDASKRGYNTITTKIRQGNSYLERLVSATGFRKTFKWNKDETKSIWIKRIDQKESRQNERSSSLS